MSANGQLGSSSPPNPMALSNDVMHLAVANKLIRYLLIKGQHTDGLFLTPANEGEVNQMRRKIKQDREAIDISAHTKNPHVIAELLIEVLSTWLSQPLLTYALYDSFVLTADFTHLNDRLTAQSQLCDSLPSYFKATVKQCLVLLLKLTENAPLTRVTLDKLSPIFTPILLRPRKVEPYMGEQDEQKVKRLFLELVGYHDVIIPQIVPGEAAPRSPLPEHEERTSYKAPRVIDMSSLDAIRQYKSAVKQYYEFTVKAHPSWEVSDSPITRKEIGTVYEHKPALPEISVTRPTVTQSGAENQSVGEVPPEEKSVAEESDVKLSASVLDILNASRDEELSHDNEQPTTATAVNDDSNDEIIVSQDEDVIVKKHSDHHAHDELIADSIDRINKFVSEEQHREKQQALSSLSGSEAEESVDLTSMSNQLTDETTRHENNNNLLAPESDL